MLVPWHGRGAGTLGLGIGRGRGRGGGVLGLLLLLLASLDLAQRLAVEALVLHLLRRQGVVQEVRAMEIDQIR